MPATRMNHAQAHTIHLKPRTVPCQPNFRIGFPEESAPRTTPWNDLCDEVLLPLGSLFVVFLACGIVIWLS
jgi:hypothetical protein